MKDLIPVYSPEDLKLGAVYLIQGALYVYRYTDPHARIEYPKFHFRCLGGQRKKADIVLNKNTIRKAYLTNYQAQPGSEVINGSIQQSLF